MVTVETSQRNSRNRLPLSRRAHNLLEFRWMMFHHHLTAVSFLSSRIHGFNAEKARVDSSIQHGFITWLSLPSPKEKQTPTRGTKQSIHWCLHPPRRRKRVAVPKTPCQTPGQRCPPPPANAFSRAGTPTSRQMSTCWESPSYSRSNPNLHASNDDDDGDPEVALTAGGKGFHVIDVRSWGEGGGAWSSLDEDRHLMIGPIPQRALPIPKCDVLEARERTVSSC